MKKSIASNKLTFDLTAENKAILEKLNSSTSIPYGRLINLLINEVCNMMDPIHDIMQSALMHLYGQAKKSLAQAKKNDDEYHRFELERELKSISNLLMFISDDFSEPSEDRPREMKKIALADGYLVIPKDWIVANEEQAQYSHNAVVIECQGDRDAPIPHFIYLFDGKSANDLSDRQEKDFYSKCIEKWPGFRAILAESNANQPIQDPDDPLRYLNADEYLRKIKIGIFYIDDAGDYPTGDPPYGAVIVRSKKEK